MRNDSTTGNGIRLRLTGSAPNLFAMGAKAVVTAGNLSQSKTVRTGSSYLSQSELVLVFGIGEATQAEVRVEWPDGRLEEVGRLDAGATYTLRQGEGTVRVEHFSRPAF